MDEKNVVNILVDQIKRQQDTITTLAKGLANAIVGILIATTITAVATIGSYFWSSDSVINVDNTNATQTDSSYDIGVNK